MPRIPIIAPSSQAVVAPAPRVYNAPRQLDNTGLSMLQQGLGNLSSGLSSVSRIDDITDRVVSQKNNIEYITAKSEYDAQLENTWTAVQIDPTVENPFLTFNERAIDLQAAYSDSITSPAVRSEFLKHVAGTFPSVRNKVLNDSLKLQTLKNVAGLHELGDKLSTTAAIGTPELRDQAIQDYNRQIDLAVGLGTLNPVQGVDAKKTFRVATMTKNMDAMARSDPYRLFQLNQKGAYDDVDVNTKLKILESARIEIDKDTAVIERRFKEAQQANEQYYGNLANQGIIPDSELEMMVKGEHPYITNPSLVRSLVAQNADPIMVGESTQVESIMLDFRSMSMSNPEKVLEATQKARTRLDAYRLQVTKRDPALIKAYATLQQAELTIASAERSARSEARAVGSEARAIEGAERARRTEEQSIVSRKITEATELYKASPKPFVMPGIMGKMQKSKEVVDLNEIHLLIRKGMEPKDAVELTLKKRKEQGSGIPTRNEPVVDLVPVR